MPRRRPDRPPLKRDRSTAGLDQVEGRQAVRELLRAGRRPVRRVYVGPGVQRSEVVAEIVALAERARAAVVPVERDRIDAMAMTDAPQGVIALAEPFPDRNLDDLLRGDRSPFLVVLDGVTDPQNLGAVMRSALCAGVTGVVSGRHRGVALTPSAVKAAAGAAEYLPLVTVGGIPAALADLRRGGIWTVAVDAGGSVDIHDLPVAGEPVALVLGAEGTGISPLARRRCELTASIPMTGPLDSLNVSAAAAVACFAVARLRPAD